AFVLWGRDENVWKGAKDPNVYEVKSVSENLLLQMGLKDWSWKQTQRSPSFLHPGQSAQLMVQGKPIGVIGTVHPKIKVDEKIRADVAFAELDLDTLQEHFTRQIKVEPLV